MTDTPRRKSIPILTEKPTDSDAKSKEVIGLNESFGTKEKTHTRKIYTSNKMPNVVLYHKGCPDGKTAAFAVYWRFREQNREKQIKFYGINPGNDKLPDYIMKAMKGADVIMCDVTRHKDNLTEMRKISNSLKVWDHHETAIPEFEGFPEADYDLDMHHSAAVMMWEAFNPTEEIPEFVKYVEDRDMFWHKMDGTHDFTSAFCTYPTLTEEQEKKFKDSEEGQEEIYNTFENYERLMKTEPLEDLKIIGYGCNTIRNPIIKRNVKAASSYFTKVNGSYYVIILVEGTVMETGSDAANQCLRLKYPFADFADILGVSYEYETTNHSLRSLDDRVNVGTFSKVTGGGGGHHNAASYRVERIEPRIGLVFKGITHDSIFGKLSRYNVPIDKSHLKVAFVMSTLNEYHIAKYLVTKKTTNNWICPDISIVCTPNTAVMGFVICAAEKEREKEPEKKDKVKLNPAATEFNVDSKTGKAISPVGLTPTSVTVKKERQIDVMFELLKKAGFLSSSAKVLGDSITVTLSITEYRKSRLFNPEFEIRDSSSTQMFVSSPSSSIALTGLSK